MEKFSGIGEKGLFLLAENRFNNSKAFYEEHKAEINSLVVNPMREVASLLLDDMYALDSKMNLRPAYMVSRIRRDTRFSKNKELYRDNIWVMFMRSKKDYEYMPCMWFEVTQSFFSCGAASFRSTPYFMQRVREAIIKNPSAFEKAVKSAENAGFTFEAQQYAREKEGDCPEKLKKYYNSKDIAFIKRSTDFKKLASGEIIGELKESYRALAPIYNFLLEVSQQILQEGSL